MSADKSFMDEIIFMLRNADNGKRGQYSKFTRTS